MASCHRGEILLYTLASRLKARRGIVAVGAADLTSGDRRASSAVLLNDACINDSTKASKHSAAESLGSALCCGDILLAAIVSMQREARMPRPR